MDYKEYKKEKETLESLLWAVPLPQAILIDMGYEPIALPVFEHTYKKGNRVSVFTQQDGSYLFPLKVVYKKTAEYDLAKFIKHDP